MLLTSNSLCGPFDCCLLFHFKIETVDLLVWFTKSFENTELDNFCLESPIHTSCVDWHCGGVKFEKNISGFLKLWSAICGPRSRSKMDDGASIYLLREHNEPPPVQVIQLVQVSDKPDQSVKVESWTVWPDLAKFRPFGKSLQVFGKSLTVYFFFVQISEPTLANLWHFWANFHSCKWPNIEK